MWYEPRLRRTNVKMPLSTLRLTNRMFCEADGNPEAACLQIRPVKVNWVLLLTDRLFSHISRQLNTWES
jgi:hypothetical protein